MHSLKYRAIAALAGVSLLAGAIAVQAQTPIAPVPITAEQAFDAVQTQVDPFTGLPARVVLVDVRTRAEYYWVGTAAQVTSLTLVDGTAIVPDRGKVVLEHGEKFVEYTVGGIYNRMLVDKVAAMKMSPLAYNVPYQLWNETTRTLSLNPDFGVEMRKLAGTVVIFYCRSGGRTDATNCVAAADPSLFQAVYEIDQPDGTTNHGGFEGSAYGNAFNGYRGSPGRDTSAQAHPSVSWKDAGLPIVIGAAPPVIPVP